MATLTASSPAPAPLKRAPSYPGERFLFGHLALFQQQGMNLFIHAARAVGDVVRFRFGPTVLYQINHPDGAQHVLQANNRNYGRQSYGNRVIRMVSGLNLFTSEGDYWLGQRRLMQPAFHRRRLDGFAAIMTDATLRMLDRWQPAIACGAYLDMHHEMMTITMDVVGRALFSVDLIADTSVLGRSFAISTDFVNHRFYSLLEPPLFIPTRRNRLLLQSRRNVDTIVQQLIDERRQGSEPKDDLLQMLMEARDEETGAAMTDEQLRAESTVIIAAGQETTSNLLTWTFHLLAEHPAAEARLRAEIDSVLGGRVPQVDDLPRLPYTRLVLDEALRLYPPAWAMTTRNALADDEILGCHIPKGGIVFIAPYIYHRDPRFWDAPDTFDPERFTEARSADRHKYAYLPFGAGPRKCIGNSFALMEAQLILATLLQRAKLLPQPGYTVVPDAAFTLRVRGGLPMRVEAR
jgi:cytochrome P450